MQASRAMAFGLCIAAVAASGMLQGCGAPSAANIKLRKELQTRDDTIIALKRQHTADLADINAARGKVSTTAALPPETLGRLFTVHGLSLGRLTGGADLHGSRPGDEGLRIYAVPTDDDGQPLKAAGSFHIVAFDLADGGPDTSREIGQWDFDTETARKNWNGAAMLYNYVLTCPWQKVTPTHPELTIRVTFKDELSGREFTEQRIVRITPPTPGK